MDGPREKNAANAVRWVLFSLFFILFITIIFFFVFRFSFFEFIVKEEKRKFEDLNFMNSDELIIKERENTKDIPQLKKKIGFLF